MHHPRLRVLLLGLVCSAGWLCLEGCHRKKSPTAGAPAQHFVVSNQALPAACPGNLAGVGPNWASTLYEPQPGTTHALWDLINQLRASQGLHGLRWDQGAAG